MEEVNQISSAHSTLEPQIFPSPPPMNLDPIEIRPSSQRRLENLRYKDAPMDQELMQELRKKFQSYLIKFSCTDTREFAFKESKKLIERNNSSEALKVYISCLSENIKSKSPDARRLEVFLLGYLAHVYKDRLIEESTPLRQLVKIAEAIQSYFKDLNKKVQESSAEALCMLYKHSLPKTSQQVVFSFMFEPLNSILTSGNDVQAQQTAALCIFKWASLLVDEKDKISLLTLYNRSLTLFLKLRADFLDLISVLGLMIQHCGFQPVIDSLGLLLNKIVMYLRHPSSNSQSMKLEACKLLGYIGKHLSDTGYLDIDRVPVEAFHALKELRTEKMPLLQSKARETLKVLEVYQRFLEETREKLQQSVANMESHVEGKAKNETFSHFRVIRNLIHIQKEKSNTAKSSDSEDSGWGIRNKGYLKRGTGNYSVTAAQGLVNITKALEKRPSVIEFLQNKPFLNPRKSVEILFKENSKVSVYERPHIFEVQPLQADCFSEQKFSKNSTPKNSEVRNSNDKYWLKKKAAVDESATLADVESSKSESRTKETDKGEGNASLQKKEFILRKAYSKGLMAFKDKQLEVIPEKDLAGSNAFFLKKKQAQDSKADEKHKKASDSDQDSEKIMKKSQSFKKLMRHEKEKSASFQSKSSSSDADTKLPKRDSQLEIKIAHKIEVRPQSCKNNPGRGFEIYPQTNLNIVSPSSNSIKNASKPNRPQSLNFAASSGLGASKRMQPFDIQQSKKHLDMPIRPFKAAAPRIVSARLSIRTSVQKFQELMNSKFKLMNQELNYLEERIEDSHYSLANIKSKQTLRMLELSRRRSESLAAHEEKASQTYASVNSTARRRTHRDSDSLANSWKLTILLLEAGEISAAFENVLEMKDDIYLLRLMHKTQPCLKVLRPDTKLRVLGKLVEILNSRFTERIGYEWVEEAMKCEIMDELDKSDRELLLDGVERLAADEKQAESVFDMISNGIFN